MKWRKPKLSSSTSGAMLLGDLPDKKHPLYLLAAAIDWQYFEQIRSKFCAEEIGRFSLPIRLLIGLYYLKYLYNCISLIVEIWAVD
jgi:hypothetical protein